MLWQYSDGDPPNGGIECRWDRDILRTQPISGFRIDDWWIAINNTWTTLQMALNVSVCWTVFARNRDTAVPAEGNCDLQTLISVLVARPRRCLTLSNPVPWQNWMAAYLGYTMRMKTLFRGWPVMAHETHTRRRRMCPFAIQTHQWILYITAPAAWTTVPKRIEHSLVVNIGKFEAELTNSKRLCLRYCTVEANYWHTWGIVQSLCDSRASCIDASRVLSAELDWVKHSKLPVDSWHVGWQTAVSCCCSWTSDKFG